jgi:protein-tyrosine phosphatase
MFSRAFYGRIIGKNFLWRLSLAPVTRICFVCLGNIVRSPLAENLFLQIAGEESDVKQFYVDSAGTGAWHIGESPDSRMRRVAACHGLIYDGKARQFQKNDFDRFDLILSMDTHNRTDLMRMAFTQEDRNKIHLLREFDPLGGDGVSVPDPYYGGIDGFEEVYQVIERSCRGLLRVLEDGHLE